MSTSAAQKLAVQKYRQEKRDQIAVDVPKGKRDVYKLIAAELNLSLSQLIQRSVEAYATNGGEALPRHPAPMESTPALPRHPAQPAPIATQPAEQISATQRRLLDVVDQLPADAQKSLLKFLQSLSKAENTAENTAENASVTNQEPI